MVGVFARSPGGRAATTRRSKHFLVSSRPSSIKHSPVIFLISWIYEHFSRRSADMCVIVLASSVFDCSGQTIAVALFISRLLAHFISVLFSFRFIFKQVKAPYRHHRGLEVRESLSPTTAHSLHVRRGDGAGSLCS